jgi:hypothetical protein
VNPASIPKEEVLSHLDFLAFYQSELGSVRPNGGDFSDYIFCPFHNDQDRPNFRVNLKNGSFICFACGKKGTVFDFYMERHGVDFLGALGQLADFAGVRGTGHRQESSRIVATYDYQDVDGNLIFQVVRFEPKSFRQRRPTGTGRWVWDLREVKRVPYRLPEILKAATVFVCEGEKDVDLLADLGVTATCNPGGALKWRPEYNHYFAGKKVVILPDNDVPGHQHAQAVARNLSGLATSVKVVELPGLPDKGDVSDWLKIGGTKEKLLELAEATLAWSPHHLAQGDRYKTSSKPEANGIPAFPQEVLVGAAGKFAHILGSYLETPPAFLFMNYLALLGHIIGDRLTLESELAPQPRLYVVNLGESADTRKSTAINKVIELFAQTIAAADLNPIHGVGSAEGLARCFEKNPQGILVLDEFKALIAKCRIDGSVLLPCINTLFELNRFHSTIKNHEIRIDRANLVLLAASTLDTFRNVFTSQFLDIGFVNRLWLVVGKSKKKLPVPPPIPESQKASLRDDLQEVLQFVTELAQEGTYRLPITKEAMAIFEHWYFSQENSEFTKRLDTYGHRLMILQAANEMRTNITAEVAERTVALLHYQLEVRQSASPIDADNPIARVEERIRRLLAGGPLKKRELERGVNKSRVGTWRFKAALKNLDGEIQYDDKTKTFFLVQDHDG